MGRLFNRVQQAVASAPGAGNATLGSALTSEWRTLAQEGAANGDLVDGFFIDGISWEARRDMPYSSTGPTLTRSAGSFVGSSTGSALSLSASAVFVSSPVAASLHCPDLFGPPGVPQSGYVRLGESSMGTVDWPSFRSAQYPERFFQPMWGATRFGAVFADPTLNGTPVLVNGNWRVTQVNNNTVGFPGTNYFLRQVQYTLGNSQVAGTMGSIYCALTTAQPLFMGTGSGGRGFVTEFAGGPAHGCSTANYRAFMGLTSSVAAPTNVDPMTLTNMIGLVRMPGSNNLQIVWAGSQSMTAGGRSAIDLGANFPANTVNTDFYRFKITSNPNDNTQIGYRVERYTGDSNTPAFVTTGTIANTTPGTTLPSTTTALSMSVWATNNTTADFANWAFSYWCFWAD